MSDAATRLKSVGTPSVRERVSKEEWEMRCDLAAAYQLAALYKWTDLIYTHFSARVPGTEYLLINPYGLMFDEITASSLVKIDKDGNVDRRSHRAGHQLRRVRDPWLHARSAARDPLRDPHPHPGRRRGVSAEMRPAADQPAFAARLLELTYHDYEGIALELDERPRHGRRSGQDFEGDDPAQSWPAVAGRYRARSVRADVLPGLRLPDSDRCAGRRPGRGGAAVASRRRRRGSTSSSGPVARSCRRNGRRCCACSTARASPTATDPPQIPLAPFSKGGTHHTSALPLGKGDGRGFHCFDIRPRLQIPFAPFF